MDDREQAANQVDQVDGAADAAVDAGAGDDDRRSMFLEFVDAINRVLEHATAHGEVYAGATADHATIRAVLEDLRQELGE